MNKATVVKWLVSQRDRAKFSWSVVVIMMGLLGYNVTTTEIVDDGTLPDKVEQRFNVVEEELVKLREAEEARKNVKYQYDSGLLLKTIVDGAPKHGED